ncbi:Mth938-like domain-containing protein [Acidithiobacillus sp. M4-SHS-6]|uniref:Mth938-like domain-containing protein n=1 Tax=Acidithiobacillus sp. M4-SHS-6 TaxID=3383024 RepID=UPI0039BE0F49
MKLHRQLDAQSKLINGYGPEGIVIQGQHYTQGVLVTPDWLQSPWGPESADALGLEHFTEVLVRKPDVMLLGTGKKQIFLLKLMVALREAGIPVEVMDTSAACRTYNILVAEDRAVLAALLHPEA